MPRVLPTQGPGGHSWRWLVAHRVILPSMGCLPPTRGWLRTKTEQKVPQTPSGFNALDVPSKGTRVDVVFGAVGDNPPGCARRSGPVTGCCHLPTSTPRWYMAFLETCLPGEAKPCCWETRSKADRTENILNKHSWLSPSAANSLAS